MTTNDMMTLRPLLEKSSDAGLLREMIGFTAEHLMALEIEDLTGAPHGERSPDRITQRNGDRVWETPLLPSAPETVKVPGKESPVDEGVRDRDEYRARLQRSGFAKEGECVVSARPHGFDLPLVVPCGTFRAVFSVGKGRNRHMTGGSFSATAWHNGSPRKSGSGYGLKISVAARDRFFDRQWQTVTLHLRGENANRTTDVNCAKDSFWNGTCRELIGRDIGIWLTDNGFAPWPRGNPPRFRVSPLEPGVFAVAPEGP